MKAVGHAAAAAGSMAGALTSASRTRVGEGVLVGLVGLITTRSPTATGLVLRMPRRRKVPFTLHAKSWPPSVRTSYQLPVLLMTIPVKDCGALDSAKGATIIGFYPILLYDGAILEVIKVSNPSHEGRPSDGHDFLLLSCKQLIYLFDVLVVRLLELSFAIFLEVLAESIFDGLL